MSWARELAQAGVMVATDAGRVRMMAVVTVVSSRLSARKRSVPTWLLIGRRGPDGEIP